MFKRRLLPWVLLVAVCTVMGFLDAFASYAAANNFGEFHLAWSRALSYDLSGWLLWVLFAPLILWLGRRFRTGRDNWVLVLVVYTLAGLSFALVRALFPVFVNFFIIYRTGELHEFFKYKYFIILSDFLVAIFVYGIILTFAHAQNYYKQYREGELKASQLEAQLAQAQLHALKMQLHPHFLFNTLNSISALQLEDVRAAQKMTARLGDFLRLTLESVGVQEVTLKREIEFLKCYLDIERVRFGQRLATRIQIEPETLDARVPNLILQPIVENAIRHGIAPRTAPGHLDISAKRMDGKLCMQIKDNGAGLSPLARRDGLFQEGLGLQNTRARLSRLYGADYCFELVNAQEGGLVVSLQIPFTANGNGH
jgi:sensor histidine kinase YesM